MPRLRINLLDDDGLTPVAARVYLQSSTGTWHFAISERYPGLTLPFDRHYPATNSIEKHTACSAHPFVFDIPPGNYTLTVERGKEYHTEERQIHHGNVDQSITVHLRRWANLQEQGWFCGDTHIHRPPEDMPVLQLAEDLHVAFPLTYWVTEAFQAPAEAPKSKPYSGRVELQHIDRSHVYWPCNTEYEIFRVGQKQHTLGAVFAIGHQQAIPIGVPPITPVAQEVRRQGGLLELDKHNWEWSMAIIPVMKVDLFELSNNHVWRTEFGFPGWAVQPPAYMDCERRSGALTEWGWIDYGFQNYYALLNCGFNLRPTAGTAAGVHPVPMGWGRVYVQCGRDFSYSNWMKGLNAGHSFVTTGPLLTVEVDGAGHGRRVRRDPNSTQPARLAGLAQSARPLDRIEVIVNGQIHSSLRPANHPTRRRGFESPIECELGLTSSSWVCVRCFEAHPSGRVRFAHTSPIWIDLPASPLRPKRVAVEFLIQRVENEIKRSRDVIPPAAFAEYEQALSAYRAVLSRSVD